MSPLGAPVRVATRRSHDRVAGRVVVTELDVSALWSRLDHCDVEVDDSSGRGTAEPLIHRARLAGPAPCQPIKLWR